MDRRSELREAVFLLLFRNDFHKEDCMMEQIHDFFDGEDEFSDAEKEKIAAKVLNVVARLPEIDAALEETSVGWKVKRMTKVDLTALRLAYYELKFDDDVPMGTAINEAVQLAKNYGTDNSGSFVNGVLAKLAN